MGQHRRPLYEMKGHSGSRNLEINGQLGTRHMCMHSQMHLLESSSHPIFTIFISIPLKKSIPFSSGKLGRSKVVFNLSKVNRCVEMSFGGKSWLVRVKRETVKRHREKSYLQYHPERSKNRRGSKKAIMNLQPRKICLLKLSQGISTDYCIFWDGQYLYILVYITFKSQLFMLQK